MSLGRTLILKTSGLKPVENLVRKSFLFRPLVGRFIAGDTLEEALKATQQLLDRGLRVSLDYLGENTANEAEALAAKKTYLEMLDRIAEVPQVKKFVSDFGASYTDGLRDGTNVEPLNISIKLTQCGLDQGFDFAEKNYRDVLERAKASSNFVRIDMEGSDYTQLTLDMIDKIRHDYANTGTVLQSYLYRNDADVQTLIDWQVRVRIVKGAYLEPASVAHPEKAKVDEQYVIHAKKLLQEAHFPAIATQDESIIKTLNEFVAEQKIPKAKFEYQMLYGIRRDLQDSLLKEGYNVRIYVPFGDSWYPYFTRRLAERPANLFFFAKSMFKG